ncbi:MAG: hypothetical protein AABZ39_03335 [Spirochaetota bacterium]
MKTASCILIAAILAAASLVGERGSFFALSWAAASNYRCDNIIPFYWLKNNSTPEQAKEFLDRYPAQNRAIFDSEYYRTILVHPKDRLTTSTGSNARGIWCENGISEAKERYKKFFAEYKRIGGALNYYIMDIEEGFTIWDLKRDEKTFEAIYGDPRFSAEGLNVMLPHYRTFIQSYDLAAHAAWNAAMWERRTHILTKAIVEPVASVFSGVRMGNYNDFFLLTGMTGELEHLIHHTKGTLLGTHQSRECYGRLQYMKGRKIDGERPFPDSPFASFIFSVNQARAMRLSSDVPFMPWIAYRGFGKGWAKICDTMIKDTDYYQESIFHNGLCRPELFLYWNPRLKSGSKPDEMADDDQDALVSAVLHELDEIAGDPGRVSLVKTLADWYGSFVLTGMNAFGRSVWRYTPDLTPGGDAMSTVTKNEPLTFMVHDVSIVIPGGKIFQPGKSTSKAGVWILAPTGTEPLVSKRR